MKIMDRTVRSAMQLGFSVVGFLVILGSLGWYAFTLSAMSPSESGFAEGLAITLLILYILIGFTVLTIGLLIPQRENEGVQFSARQRKLLMYGAVAPLFTGVLILFGAKFSPPLTEPALSIAVALLSGLIFSGPTATILAVVSKIVE